MATKNIAITVKAKDEASGALGKVAGSINKVNKEIKSSDVSKLSSSFKGLKSALAPVSAAVAAGAKVISDYTKAINKCSEMAHKQIVAEKQLAVAVKNNPFMGTEQMNNLKAYASELQKVSNYGDEQLIPMMAELASKGIETSDIMKIMSTAIDLSSGGMVDLQGAVTQLSNSLNGSAGKLATYCSGVKDLTKEELKNGDAIDIIAKAYKGMGEAVVDSKTQMQNALGDFIESVGKLTKPATDAFYANWKKTFEDLATLFNNFNETLDVNITGRKWVNEGVKSFASSGNVNEAGARAYAQSRTDSEIDLQLKYLNSMEFSELSDAQVVLLSELRTEKDARAEILKETEAQAKAQAEVTRLAEEKAKSEAEQRKIWAQDKASYTNLAAAQVIKNQMASGQITSATGAKQLGLISEEYQTALKKQKSYGTGTEQYKQITAFIKSLEESWDIAIQNESEARMNAIDAAIRAEEKASKEKAEAEVKAFNEQMQNFRSGILGTAGSTGELANTIMDYMEGSSSLTELIINLVTPVLNKLSTMSEGFANFSNLVDDIYEVLADDLVMVFDLLQPVFDFVASLVTLLNPLLKVVISVITPILELIMRCLTWIAQGLQSLWEKLVPFFNAFIRGINGIITGINNVIHFFSKKAAGLSLIGELSSESAFSVASATGTTTSGSATYSGAKDVYVNIYYSNSYVNGDAREIALNIRNEINLAEKLGY